MLLEFGLAQEAADTYHNVLASNKDDADAYLGLGEAEAALWNYSAARDAFRHAQALAPSDATIGARLELSEQVLALDPTVPKLHAAERYRRSQKLLELALGALDQCGASHPEIALPAAASELADRVRKELAGRQRPKSYGDAADESLATARKLWESRPKACQAIAGPGDALTQVMAHLPR